MTSFSSQQPLCSSIDEYFRLHLFPSAKLQVHGILVFFIQIFRKMLLQTLVQIEMALSEKREYITY
jgi:hypothetical protein